jgi:GTP-binding protein
VPILFISAKNDRNLDKIFPEVEKVLKASQLRLSTHQLNKFLTKAMQLNHPTMLKGRRLRIYYMTQVDTFPPRFILFVNHPSLMEESYKKYLQNQLRSHFDFPGVPFRFHLKGKARLEMQAP